MIVANPVRPETATTETGPLDNEVDGEASNTDADTANADTNNPLDNEVKGDSTDGDGANIDEPNNEDENLLGASTDELERPDLMDPETQEAMVAGEATVTRQKRRKWSLKPWSLKP